MSFISQKIIEAQTETYLFSQLLSLESQRQNFKCPYKSLAQLVCINSQCKNSGFICSHQSCQCLKMHSKCQYIQINQFFYIIGRHQKQIPQNIKKSYKLLHQIIDGLIDQLSQIKWTISLEEKYFRLKKQELAFMALIDQQKIEKFCEKICGKVVFQLKKTLKQDISFTILNHKQMLEDFKSKKINFDYFVKYIQDSYTKYDFNNGLLDGSKIANLGYQKEIMQKWLSENLNKNTLSSKLLFRASEHNFSPSQFHKRCDGIQNTLVIAKTQHDKVIGGFTPNKWHSEKQQYVYDATGKAFMFSLSLMEKYKCTDPVKSIWCDKFCGPTFGGGHDLLLYDNSYYKNYANYANFPFSYNLQMNGVNKYHHNLQTDEMFSGVTNGNNKFKIKQYEVYEIKEI